MANIGAHDFRIQAAALKALQEFAKIFFIAKFKDKLFKLIILSFILI